MIKDDSRRALWLRIENFSLDDSMAAFSFTMRLARENNWRIAYAQRVVNEYKKFMFLAVTCDHDVTPSEQIDQAWHLHMIYTHSYWEQFCGDVLGQPVHHGPTKGGTAEKAKYEGLYEQTKSSYREYFFDEPPKDIWPSCEDRFGRDLHFQRINRNDFWLIRKPNFRSLVSSPFPQLYLAAASPALLLAWSPFELSGLQFLLFYAVLGLVAVVFVFVLQLKTRASGATRWSLFRSKSGKLTVDHLAYLSGGQTRLLQMGLSEILMSGNATVLRQQLHVGNSSSVDALHSRISKAIFNKLNFEKTLDFSSIKSATKLDVASVSRQLVEMGLIQEQAKRYAVTSACAVIFSSVLLVGVVRVIQELGNGIPVGFLLIEMVLVLIALCVSLYTVPLRTKKGEMVYSSMTELLQPYMETAGTLNQMELVKSVAVFGTSFLVLTDFTRLEKDIKRVLSSPISADGEGGSGCGADGGCGGGCGGCGG